MTGQPEILNLAFKEIAQKAWNAAMEQVAADQQSFSPKGKIRGVR